MKSKTSQLLGNASPDTDALEEMRRSPANKRGTKWAAYQNHDLGHEHLGHLRFLAVGPNNTLRLAPDRHPDIPEGVMWRYVFVGYVDTRKGVIVPAAPPKSGVSVRFLMN